MTRFSSSRRFARAMAGASLLSTAAITACETPKATGDNVATLVLQNGTVITVDSVQPTAQAIAMKGARILAVGTDREIKAYIGDSTQVIDLKGRVAMPGFIDSHGHYLSLGDSKMVLDLTTAKRWEDIVEMVKTAAATAKPGAWIVGRGWHQEKWDQPPAGAIEGYPVHAELSAASPNNPVLLTHASGHAAFANKKALDLAKISRTTPAPEGGEFVKGPNGELTGLLRETAQRVVGAVKTQTDMLRPVSEREGELRKQVELAGQEALSYGVTSFHDAGENFAIIDFLKKLETEGALPVRLYVMIRRENNATLDKLLPQYLMPSDGDDYLTVRSIKRQIDGALGSHGAWLLKPYIDITDTYGKILEDPKDVEGTAEVAIKHGFQVNTHAIGDSANRVVLDIYERVFKKNPDKADLRWRIEHAQHVDAADVPRFKQLGVIAAMQGVHATSDGPWIPKRLGEERAIKTSYVWRDLIGAGTIISNGTDVPVENINPIASFYSSVSRVTKEGSVFSPNQKMTREEALRSYTINGAYAAFEEKEKGSLTPGKLADVVVLSKNIMTIPEAEIPTAVVDLTILGGRVRYERK